MLLFFLDIILGLVVINHIHLFVLFFLFIYSIAIEIIKGLELMPPDFFLDGLSDDRAGVLNVRVP